MCCSHKVRLAIIPSQYQFPNTTPPPGLASCLGLTLVSCLLSSVTVGLDRLWHQTPSWFLGILYCIELYIILQNCIALYYTELWLHCNLLPCYEILQYYIIVHWMLLFARNCIASICNEVQQWYKIPKSRLGLFNESWILS